MSRGMQLGFDSIRGCRSRLLGLTLLRGGFGKLAVSRKGARRIDVQCSAPGAAHPSVRARLGMFRTGIHASKVVRRTPVTISATAVQTPAAVLTRCKTEFEPRSAFHHQNSKPTVLGWLCRFWGFPAPCGVPGGSPA